MYRIGLENPHFAIGFFAINGGIQEIFASNRFFLLLAPCFLSEEYYYIFAGQSDRHFFFKDLAKDG
jgi:hypothetical protein